MGFWRQLHETGGPIAGSLLADIVLFQHIGCVDDFFNNNHPEARTCSCSKAD